MNILSKTLVLATLLSSLPVHAGGVTVGGTRLIFDGKNKESSLSVTNSDTVPYLIQSWAEVHEGNNKKSPFIVTPPLFRLESNQQNVLRIVRAGESLPEDRESLYWLNIKSIPRASAQQNANTLQIAVKSRIKLIYRPDALSGRPEQHTDKLTWSVSGKQLTVTNPTPFVMNFKQVLVGGQKVKDATYVLPMSQATFTAPSGAAGKVSWKLITDFGGVGPEHSAGS